MFLTLLFILSFSSLIQAYIIRSRFGHSAVLINDSIYFYGGDSSISSNNSTSTGTSELSILPINSPFSLVDPPWKPASGPQDVLGGPFVFSHIAFLGGSMMVMGGLRASMSDDEPLAFSYDYELGRWNSFSLPAGNNLNRQGAACSTTTEGITYIWGGKKTNSTTKSVLSTNMYRFNSLSPENSEVISTTTEKSPPLRYGHTQTLLGDQQRIVVLGGFDSYTGDAISLSDVWVYHINTSSWSHVQAKLDDGNKPANRSSHSQVLMPDGFSILVYAGYDGFYVYSDVAVLDTRTWTWSVKNTNAAVQGRADHTATMVGTNMIVAFGFTGVSTTLTVMSDIEVLDTVTWSWTAFYTPSGNDSTREKLDGMEQTNEHGPNSPSTAIVLGAVTGGLAVLVILLIIIYMVNIRYYHQKPEKENKNKRFSSTSTYLTSFVSIDIHRQSEQNLPTLFNGNTASSIHRDHSNPYNRNGIENLTMPTLNEHHCIQEIPRIRLNDPPVSMDTIAPMEFRKKTFPKSKKPFKHVSPGLRINTSNLPIETNTVGTAGTKNSAHIMLPSPWTTIRPMKSSSEEPYLASPMSALSFDFFRGEANADWAMNKLFDVPSGLGSVSKPDDKFYPLSKNKNTISTTSRNNSSSSHATSNKASTSSSSSTLSNDSHVLHKIIIQEHKEYHSHHLNNNSTSTITSFKTCCIDLDLDALLNEDKPPEEDLLFDRQEFILHGDEVEKTIT